MFAINFNRLIIGFAMIFAMVVHHASAQVTGNEKEKAPVSFGKIKPEDFKQVYTIDSAATAIVVADVGSSKIQGNNSGWFSVIHTHYKRVHILNKAAYDLADVSINLYVDNGDQERLVKIKANTYNLEGDQIVTNELGNKDVFSDKGDKNHITKKFTFPNVKEGTIIEYEYTTSSDFLFNFQPWSFQGTIPRLWTEYTVEIPQFLDYVFLSYGYNPFYIRSEKSQERTFNVNDAKTAGNAERFQFNNPVKTIRFVMKDVQALKEEPFTSTLANHTSRIEFQLSGYRDPLPIKRILGDWATSSTKLLSYEDFGADLYKKNQWLTDELKSVAATDTSKLEKAKAIYYYIRNQYKSNGGRGIFMSNPGLKNVVKAKGGKVADINLLLTAMLHANNISAYPVILSTADHGIAHAYYPLLSQYNYVVVKAIVAGKSYLLDASQSSLPFGKLMPYCYNGIARIIDNQGEPVLLTADSLKEASQIYVRISADEKGQMKGEFKKKLGDYECIRIKAKMKDEGIEGLKRDVEKSLGTAMLLQDLKLEEEENELVKPSLSYVYTLNNNDEDLLFINPLQTEQTKQNPFVSATRSYPIEMPYGFDEILQFSLSIPEGYVLDEMPKSMIISLDEERKCTYQYRILHQENKIELLSRLTFNRANFDPEEYDLLRSFFDLIVKKQNESIVLKRN